MEIADFRHNPEKIALLTDSCADLNEKHRKNKPIFVVPLKIRGGQREFSDGVDIFAEDIYRFAKVRGRKAVQPKLIELLQIKQVENKRYNIAIANGGAPKEMAELAKKIRDEFPEAKHFWEGEMDATLSTYIGSGVLGACIQFLD